MKIIQDAYDDAQNILQRRYVSNFVIGFTLLLLADAAVHPAKKLQQPEERFLEVESVISKRSVPAGGLVQTSFFYNITVVTLDRGDAGTDANVFIRLYDNKNPQGHSKAIQLQYGGFERGQTDRFSITIQQLLSPLSKVEISHDNAGHKPGWLLGRVIVECPSTGIQQVFICNRWLALDEDDGSLRRTLYEDRSLRRSIPPRHLYGITVVTRNFPDAGTDANIQICLYGSDNGKVCQFLRGGGFERGQTDRFYITMTQLLSPLSKIEIGHDNAGHKPGWLLERVIVDCPSTGIQQVFICNRWLALDEDDGSIRRTLYEEMSLRKP